MTTRGESAELERIVAVPESLEHRDAVVAQIEKLGGVAVTPSELEAMQQQIEATKPVEQQTYAIRRPSILALAAMAAVAVGPDPFRRRPSFTERHGLDRAWDASEKAQAEKIAAAKAKRERKAKRRASVEGSEEKPS